MGAPTDWYVDPVNGSNSNGGTSLVDAWQTLNHAFDTVDASESSTGDTLNIRNNATHTLTANIVLSNYASTTAKPITFRGFTDTIGDGGKAIIDGASTYKLNTAGTTRTNANFIDVELKDIAEATTNVLLSVTNGELFNVTLNGTAGTLQMGAGARVFDVNVVNCTGDSSYGIIRFTSTYSAKRIFASGNSVPAIYSGGFGTIDNAIINTATGVSAIATNSSGVSVRNSSFIGSASTVPAISVNYIASDVVVDGCIFSGFNGTGGSGVSVDAGGTRTVSAGTVANCSFYNCSSNVVDSQSRVLDTTGNETLSGNPFAASGSSTDPTNASTYYAPQDVGNVLTADGFGHVRGAIAGVAVSGGEPDLTDWDGYLELTSDSASLPALNTHVLIDLSVIPTDHTWWTKVDSAGDDIRVADESGNILPYKLVPGTFSATGKTGELWVDIATYTSLSTSADKVLKIYAGNTAASAPVYTPFDPTGSPVQGFALQEDPSGSSPQMADFVGGNNGTSYGTMTSGDRVTGLIGKALEFDGSDDYISAPLPAGFVTDSPWTIACCVKINSYTAGTTYTFLSIGGTGVPIIWLRKSGSNNWGGAVASEYGAPYYQAESAVNAPTVGQWYRVYMTFDGTYIQMYVDGVVSGSPVAATLYLASGPLFIGTYGGSGSFPGSVDNVLLIPGALSANQIAALDANIAAPDGIWTVGEWATGGGGSGGGGGGFPLIGSGGLIL